VQLVDLIGKRFNHGIRLEENRMDIMMKNKISNKKIQKVIKKQHFQIYFKIKLKINQQIIILNLKSKYIEMQILKISKN